MRSSRLFGAILGSLLLLPAVHAAELNIGDKAPALDYTKWVKGQPVELSKAAGEKIVVLEFWATWCGPCIESIPHLTKLQKDYGDQGLLILGSTSEDPNNSLDDVEKFVKKQGDKMDYRIAFDKEGKMDKAYMEAAEQAGIPTAFVIDKQGRVAWIGHPQAGLEDAVKEMIAGKYDIKLARKKYELDQQMMEASFSGDVDKMLSLSDEYEKADPDSVYPWTTRLMVYTVDRPDMAKKTEVAEMAAQKFAHSAEPLATLASTMVWQPEDSEAEAEDGAMKKLQGLAVKMANHAAELAPKNPEVLSNQYSVLAAAGMDNEAMEVAGKALKLMKDDPAELGSFARRLSSPDAKDLCNDLALKAVDLALAAEPDEPRHLQTKFHILAACKRDVEGAKKIGHYLVEQASDDASLLNNFSWQLLTEEPFAGKYNELALAAAEKCHEASGGKNWMYLDTLALAKFETGNAEEAVKLEEKALELCDQEAAKIALQEALDRFKSGKK